jgi:HPt (histidine-containing phosphotransfer) domain-containing protein
LGIKLAYVGVPAAAEARDRLVGDPIDRAYLARFTLRNAALEREVLELFAEQAPLYLERLRRADGYTAWRHAAHTIKGSASAVGAWRLARFAEMAEQVDVEADAARSEGYREEAVAAVATAIDEARRYIARLFDPGCQA